MTSGEFSGRNEFSISPGAYSIGEFQPLLDRPEVRAEDASDSHMQWVFDAFVNMCQAALSKEDLPGYHAWMHYAETYADVRRLYSRTDESFFRSYLVELQFLGVLHGDVESAAKLHSSLTDDPGKRKLNNIVDLCAQHDVASPAAWIEQYTSTPDQTAEAWHSYFMSREYNLEERSEYQTSDEARVPGFAHYLTTLAEGEITKITLLTRSRPAFLLAEGPQKERITRRYMHTLQEAVQANDFYDIPFGNVYEIGALIVTDPELPTELKIEIANLITDLRAPWGEDAPYPNEHDSFALSLAAAQGKEVGDVLQNMEQRVQKVSSPYIRQGNRDALLSSISQAYVRLGKPEAAAAALARINRTTRWHKTFLDYASKRGNIGLTIQADVMRQMMTTEETSSETPHWQMRTHLANFLLGITENNFESASQTLVDMAKGIKEGELSESSSTVVTKALRQLLKKYPAQARHIGPILTTYVLETPGYTNRHELFSLLAAQGVNEAANANGILLQRIEKTQGLPVDPLSYFWNCSTIARELGTTKA